ncbi:MAG: glycosyltransferase family 4 protein [Anaerolineae bacterium]
MKVALVVPGGVDRSGRERVIPALLWLIERLARRHQLLVVALRQEPMPTRYPLLGAQVVNLGQPDTRLPGLRLWTQLRRLIAVLTAGDRPVDLIHGFWLGEAGLLAGLAGRWLRLPVIVSVGGGELVSLPDAGYGGWGDWRGRLRASLALRMARAATAGSHYARAPLDATGRTLHWLPLGVDTRLFDAPIQRAGGPPWRLLHVSSINRVKDPGTLLHAVRLVADRQPDLQLDWVGIDTLSGAAQRLAASLGLAGLVHFHGFRPIDQIAPLYRRAHLYLQSSLHESQGVAVCEAAAAGLPTVGTAVGLVAEWAPDAALAVPVADPRALAGGILELLADSTRRASIGRRAQAWARAHDADWTAAQFEALYENTYTG